MKTYNVVVVGDDVWARVPQFVKTKEYGLKKLRYLYGRFIVLGRKFGLDIYRSTFDWYKKGEFTKGWSFKNKWEQAYHIRPDIIFDKSSMDKFSLKYKKMFDKKAMLLNPLFIQNVCDDKNLTYHTFPNLTPRSFLVNNKKQLKKVLGKIRTKNIVLKPVIGSSAKGVIITSKGKVKRVKPNTLIQEFIDTSKGVPGLTKGVSEIRLIIIDGKLDHGYLRIAKKGWISNVSRGGRLAYFSKNKITELIKKGKFPKKIIKLSRNIDSKFKKYRSRILAIDFIFDEKARPWLVELNSKVGLTDYSGRLEKDFFSAVLNSIRKACERKL